MSWLKKAMIEHNKPKESVIDTLKKNLAGYEQGRCRSVLHASDITKSDFCPRHEAFLDLQGVKEGKGGYVSMALRVTYDMGSETERMLVEHWGGDAIKGNWRCRICLSQRTMCSNPQGFCDEGTRHDWEYMQWPAISNEYGVSGSIDSLWDVGASLWLMVECKIMAPAEFDTIIAPLPEHRIRTNLYLKLIADSNSPYKDRINLHEARVLYTSRGYGKGNAIHANEVMPFKEYTVLRDDASLLPLLNKAKQLKVFREQKLMPSGICATALDKVAKKCPNCMACFNGQNPAQQESL